MNENKDLERVTKMFETNLYKEFYEKYKLNVPSWNSLSGEDFELSCQKEESIINTWWSEVYSAQWIEVPKDIAEFRVRLQWVLHDLYKGRIGKEYQKRKKSLPIDPFVDGVTRRLAQARVMLKKQFPRVQFGESQVRTSGDDYLFLKMLLETNYCVDPLAQQFLGIKIDTSGLTNPQKNAIAAQCAAQVLWCLEGNTIPTIEAMVGRLKNKGDPLCHLLQLGCFDDITLKRWIRSVFPVPEASRKGRHPKGGKAIQVMGNLVCIPEVFLEDNVRVNFLKLKFAITCTTRILKVLGWEIDKITNSEFIQSYVTTLRFHPARYVKDWAQEAFAENGSIFDL